MKMRILLAVIVSVLPWSVGAWEIGEEREVEQGAYVTRYGEVGNFQIWKRETRDGIDCLAVSHVNGLHPPYKDTWFFNKGPQVHLRYYEGDQYSPKGLSADVMVSYSCNIDVQWRKQ